MTSQETFNEVRELDLTSMNFTDEELIVKLRAVAASSVVELNLKNVSVEKVPTKLLAKIVSRLSKLNLSWSRPTKEQCVAVLKACIPPTTMTKDLEKYQTLRGLPVDLLVRGFGNLPQMTHINLSGCSNLREVPDDLLVKALSNLTHINIDRTYLTRQQCVAVIDMCASSRSLVELSLKSADLADVPPQTLGQAVRRLTKISLAWCKLTGDQLIEVLDACARSATLKHVNISGNRNLQQVPAEQLAKAVGNLDTVRCTNPTTEQCIAVLEKCKSSKLSDIDLSDADLRQVTPELLEEALRSVQRMGLVFAKMTTEQRIVILNTVLTPVATVRLVITLTDREKASLPEGLLIRAKETGRLNVVNI